VSSTFCWIIASIVATAPSDDVIRTLPVVRGMILTDGLDRIIACGLSPGHSSLVHHGRYDCCLLTGPATAVCAMKWPLGPARCLLTTCCAVVTSDY